MIRRWLAHYVAKVQRAEAWLRAGQLSFAAGGACYLLAAAYAAFVAHDRAWAVIWMVSSVIDAAVVVFLEAILRARRNL